MFLEMEGIRLSGRKCIMNEMEEITIVMSRMRGICMIELLNERGSISILFKLNDSELIVSEIVCPQETERNGQGSGIQKVIHPDLIQNLLQDQDLRFLAHENLSGNGLTGRGWKENEWIMIGRDGKGVRLPIFLYNRCIVVI
jgi:hypothetical protein